MGQAQAAPTEYTLPAQPVAGFTPDQLAAFQNIRDMQGMGQPYIDTAYQMAQQGAAPAYQAVDQYLNPYIDWVTKNLNEIFGKQMRDVTGGLTQAAGGVGAPRIAVGQSELARQQGLSAGQTYADIYNRALAAAQADASRKLQSAGLTANLGPMAQNLALQGTQALLGAGGQQQQLSQAEQQALWNQLASQFSFQFQRPQYEAGILGALAPAAGGTTQGYGTQTTQQPAPSMFSQILGGVTGGLGTLGGMGAFSGNKGSAYPTGFSGSTAGPSGNYVGYTPWFGMGTPVYGPGFAEGGSVDANKQPVSFMDYFKDNPFGGLFGDEESQKKLQGFIGNQFTDLLQDLTSPGKTLSGIFKGEFPKSGFLGMLQSGQPMGLMGLLGKGRAEGGEVSFGERFPQSLYTNPRLSAALSKRAEILRMVRALQGLESTSRADGGAAIGMNPFRAPDFSIDMPLQPRPTNFPKGDIQFMQPPKEGGGDLASTAIQTAMKVLPMLLINRGGAVPRYQGGGGIGKGNNLPGGNQVNPANMTQFMQQQPGLMQPGQGIGQWMQNRQPGQWQNWFPNQDWQSKLPQANQDARAAYQADPAAWMAAHPQAQAWMAANMPQQSGGINLNNLGSTISNYVQNALTSANIPTGNIPNISNLFSGIQSAIPQQLGKLLPQQVTPTTQVVSTMAPFGAGASGGAVGPYSSFRGYQFGGGTGQRFDPNWQDYDSAQFVGGDDDVDIGPPIRMPDQAAMQRWREDTDRVIKSDPDAAPAKAALQYSENEEIPEKATLTGGPDRRPSPFAPYRYPGPTEMPRSRMPYPDATRRGMGEDFSHSPWSALARAGFAIMGGTSPYAGVNIGRGALEGLKTFEEQRKTKMEEEQINQRAQQLWNQMQTHADQYRYMTPAQIETAKHQRMQDWLRERKEAYDQRPMGRWIVYTPKDPRSGLPVYRVNPRTGEVLEGGTGTEAAPRPEEKPGVPPRRKEGEEKKPIGSDYPALPPDDVLDEWTVGVDPQSKMLGRQNALPDLKQASTAASAAQGTVLMLEQTERALSELPKTGPLAAGPYAQMRGNIIRNLNTTAQFFGLKDEKGQPWAIKPEAVGSLEELNKLTTRMGFELARTLGAREAMQIVQQAISAVPGSDNTPLGARKIISGIRAAMDQSMAWHSFLERWVAKTGSNMGAREYFNDMRPASYWNAKHWAELVDPKDRAALMENRTNAEARKAIDHKYGPGVSKFILQQEFGPE